MTQTLYGLISRARVPLALSLTALLVAACGSSSSNSPTATSGGSAGTSATSSPSNASTKAVSGAKPTVKVVSVAGFGKVLANGAGKPLYLLTADPKNSSKCSGACAKQWPPLTISGKPFAGPGVTGSLLSQFKRGDGRTQVLYNGHALYTYSGPGVTGGAGLAANGGVWYLIAPNGSPVKTTASGGY